MRRKLDFEIHEWARIFAVWCGYKYLNGVRLRGRMFVHERHSNAWNLPRFAGWWGHDVQTRLKWALASNQWQELRLQLSNPRFRPGSFARFDGSL